MNNTLSDLNSSDTYKKEKACWKMLSLNNEAIDVSQNIILLGKLLNDKEKKVRWAAICVLKNIAERVDITAVLSEIERILMKDRKEFRLKAIWTLCNAAKNGFKIENIGAVGKALNDNKKGVRKGAIITLKELAKRGLDVSRVFDSVKKASDDEYLRVDVMELLDLVLNAKK